MSNTPIHLLVALRQYRHNNSPEFLMGYDYTEVNKVHKFLLGRIAELEKNREVRDLEQQAKGLEDYVSEIMDNNYILHLDPEDIRHCVLIKLNATALRLLERAKVLKEQE